MIARLRGALIESTFTDCVIEAGGVGYEVLIPVSTFEKLPRPGSEATLLVHTQVREDAITLYGFATAAERDLFRRLIGVSGVGGKLALNILSGMPVETFRAAVAGGDVKLLARISGIGKRTAERLVVELKDKLGDGLGAEGAPSGPDPQLDALRDVAAALEQLGFKREAIDRTLRQLAAEEGEKNAEALLREAIRRLNF